MSLSPTQQIQGKPEIHEALHPKKKIKPTNNNNNKKKNRRKLVDRKVECSAVNGTGSMARLSISDGLAEALLLLHTLIHFPLWFHLIF